MATTILKVGAEAHLPALPLAVLVDADNLTPFDLDVTPGVAVIRPRPGMIVLPTLPDRAAVAVVPRGGGTFPAGSVLHVTAAVGDPMSPDADRVILDSIDVSGLRRREMLVIVSDGRTLTLHRAGKSEDPKLSPLAEATLVVARQLLGVERVPNDHLVRLDVIVDGSASMALAGDDGSLGAALDLLAGISPVVAVEKSLDVTVVGAAVRPIAVDLSEVAAAVTAAVTAAPPPTGFRLPPVIADGAPRLRYVVSDAPPARYETTDPRLHTIVLATDDAAPVLARMWNGPLTVLGPAGGRPVAARLLADPAHLHRVTAGLVAPWRALAGVGRD